MPLTPEDARATTRPEPETVQGSRLGSLTFAAVALIAGILLVMLPWSEAWGANYAQRIVPGLRDIWNDAYFRGAITGLGVVNIYFACLEIARLRRIP